MGLRLTVTISYEMCMKKKSHLIMLVNQTKRPIIYGGNLIDHR